MQYSQAGRHTCKPGNSLRIPAPGRCGVWWSVVLLALAACASAQAVAPQETRWNELGALIVGRDIQIPLAGGIKVEGQALGVRDQSLTLSVASSTDPKQYPKGETSIPRSAVTEVLVLHRKGGISAVGAVLGAFAGFVAGMAIGEGPMKSSSNAAGGTMVLGVTAAGGTAGYLLGRQMGKRWKSLRIEPAKQ